MNSGTPETWQLAMGQHEFSVYGRKSGTICRGTDELVNWRENAYLLVAAQDLFKALENLVEWGCTHTSPRDPNTPHELLIAGRDALSRAKSPPEQRVGILTIETHRASCHGTCCACGGEIAEGAACLVASNCGLVCSMECGSRLIHRMAHSTKVPERSHPTPYVCEMTSDEPTECLNCGKTIPAGQTIYGNDDQDEPDDFVDGDCCSVECLIETIKDQRENR